MNKTNKPRVPPSTYQRKPLINITNMAQNTHANTNVNTQISRP